MTSGEGLNAYGAATWGQFFIYQGFNAQTGWMHTTSTVDNVDEFAETVTPAAGGLTYRYGQQNRAVTVRPITVSFRKVAALQANSSNNTLFASNHGETALFLPQFMPRRDNRFDYTLPVDGSDPATDWRGLHPLSELPEMVNPANGWVFNVNDGPWWAAGEDSPKREVFAPYFDKVGRQPRTAAAPRVLSATPRFTLDGLDSAAYDPWLPLFAEQFPGLIAAHAKAPDPARAEAFTLLAKWDHRASLTSTETSLAAFWAEALWANGAEAAETQRISVQQWMATKAGDGQKLAALDEAMARLTADFGSWQVPWGEINRFQRNDGAIIQTFDDARPSTPVPFASALWGSFPSFRAQRYPGTKRYYSTRGNSFVAVIEFGPRIRVSCKGRGQQQRSRIAPL